MVVAVAVLIAITVLVILARVRRTFGPTEAIARWAAARGLAVRGDGLTGPVHVVGARAGRMFTLTLSRSQGSELLMIATDCETAATGTRGTVGGGPVEAGGEALAVKIQNPPAELWDRLDELVDGLVSMAEALEAEEPGTEAE